ncbi:MAG TPA: helix-turn-helix domain-containing protein, partial [Candidatus Nanopelagicaceae bacterium]|nr:helix-turn-helix domain-containing protein [Candidatus Nanopelagicaceae bacterium]
MNTLETEEKKIMIQENNMTSSQTKLTNSQKILNYLLENSGEISNEELSRETGIDKTNIPREIKKLEEKGHIITKRYERVGRAKFVWFQLTNSQNNMTSSQEKKTSSQEKNKFLPPEKKNKTAISLEPKLNPKQNIELTNYFNGLATEIQLLGRTIPLDVKQKIVQEIFENLKNLTKGMKYYLNAWEARYKRYSKEKPENPLIDEYEDMGETLEV